MNPLSYLFLQLNNYFTIFKQISSHTISSKLVSKMSKSEIQDNIPPPGYPTENSPPAKKKGFFRTKKKGEKGFIEGCLAALCCCWLCETCC